MSRCRLNLEPAARYREIALLCVAKRAGFVKVERAGLNYPCPDCKGAGYQLVNAKIAFPKH